jgi:hypothetical protein
MRHKWLYAQGIREILLSFVARMESLSEPTVADGFTNRQHDREIYGEPR